MFWLSCGYKKLNIVNRQQDSRGLQNESNGVIPFWEQDHFESPALAPVQSASKGTQVAARPFVWRGKPGPCPDSHFGIVPPYDVCCICFTVAMILVPLAELFWE